MFRYVVLRHGVERLDVRQELSALILERGRRVFEVLRDLLGNPEEFHRAGDELANVLLERLHEIPLARLDRVRALEAAHDVVEGVLGEVAPRTLALAALRFGLGGDAR